FLLCDTPPATALYSLSLHDALPISDLVRRPALEAEVRVALPVDVGAERVAERGVHEVTEVRRLRHPAEVGAERGLRRHRQRDAEAWHDAVLPPRREDSGSSSIGVVRQVEPRAERLLPHAGPSVQIPGDHLYLREAAERRGV